MSLDVGTQWEVRTTGSDSNGGGFVAGASGTDYSQQDSAQFSGTAGTAAGTAAFTDVAHAFVSTDVGNLIQIASGVGFTPGFYQILSVSTGIATLDRSPGTGTVAVWALGGGLQTIATAVANLIGSNTVWIKSGTLTITTALTLTSSQSGSATGGDGPTIFEGYNSTHGDLGTAPLITTSTNSVHIWILSGVSSIVFRNLSLKTTAGTPGNGITAPGSSSADSSAVLIDKCTLDGFTNGIYFDGNVVFSCHALEVTRCEIKNCVTHAIANTYSTFTAWNYIHNNGGIGFFYGTYQPFLPNQTFSALFNIFYANNYGWDSNATNVGPGLKLMFIGNVFSDSTNDGIRLTANTSGNAVDVTMWNNIFYANGGYGVNNPNSSNNLGFVLRSSAGNAYGANVTAPSLNWVAANIVLSGDPFVNRTGGNFALNNTAGAGAACRAAGFPGAAPAGTGYLDVGALQHQDSGGGGGTTYVIAPNITNIIQE